VGRSENRLAGSFGGDGVCELSVVEWTAYFRNDGKADAPILEYVQALDVSFPVAGEGVPTILTPRDAVSWIPMRW